MEGLSLLNGPYAKAARRYFDRGWRGVLPMPRGSLAKRYPPTGYTGKKGAYPTGEQIDRWVRSRGDYNVSIRLPAGVIGLDVDAYEGKQGGATLAALEAELGSLPATVRSTSRTDGVSGIRLFRLELRDDVQLRGELGPGIELVHQGLRYVVAAPSVHPGRGERYRWLDQNGQTVRLPSPDELPKLPTGWLDRVTRPKLASVPEASSEPRYGAGQRGTGYGVQAMLRELSRLRRVWDDDVDAFNPELNKVAFRFGQLAAGGELDPETSRGELEDLLSELGAPADQWRTVESGFTSGMDQPRSSPATPDPSSPDHDPANMVPPATAPDTPTPVRKRAHALEAGGLRSAPSGHFLEMYQRVTVDRKSGRVETQWLRWSNFDIRAMGRVVDDDGRTTGYNVELIRERDSAKFDTILPVRALARTIDLNRWLLAYEVSCFMPGADGPSWSNRLGEYLADQQAPVARTSACLGWDDASSGFVTFEGVITADGLQPFNGVRPDPELRGKAIQYRYGFEADPQQAVDTLREVLTFHDSTVTSVFGAWWAACLLKGQIMPRVSMFPVMAIEATSESGKSSGFFPMMTALAGNRRGQSNDTVASFRDVVAGHRNGIAWQDDLDEPKRLFELIRAATAEGTTGKKAEDRTVTVDAKLVAPIMISGEGLDVTKQKALSDRVLLLSVPSPKGRMSLHDPTRPQWRDIVALRDRWPDLTALAGHLVAAALRHADMVASIAELQDGSPGRHGDKIAVLRLGARILSAITGDAHHVDVVDRWATGVRDVGNENVLTLSLVPEYLSLVGAIGKPERRTFAPHHSVPTPVLIRPDKNGVPAVWVSTDLLSQWWKEHRSGRIESRTETAEALRQQATELGMKGIKAGQAGIDHLRIRVRDADEHNGRAEMRTWQRLPSGIADRLLSEYDEAEPPPPPDRDIVRTARGGHQVTGDTVTRLREARRRLHRDAN